MTKLALTPRFLTDKYGAAARTLNEQKELGLNWKEMEEGFKNGKLEGFKDHGLVEYNGMEYFMSTYDKPEPQCDDDEWDD